VGNFRIVARGSSGAEHPKAPVRAVQRIGPGPVLRESEYYPPGPVHESGTHVQEPVAKGLGLGPAQLALETDQFQPGQQVGAGENQLQPRSIGPELGEGHAVQAGVSKGLESVLDPGMAALAQLEDDGVTLAVGEGDLMAPAIGVPQTQLSTGMGLLTPTDGSGPLRPPIEDDVELGHSPAWRGPPSPSMAGVQPSARTAEMAWCKALLTRA